ncbi:MAG: hypothetical protein K2Y26_17480 [Gemmatimonadaceae bacterium]|nr:hypothetical protein [Gemmatimonadaceae bacterium]
MTQATLWSASSAEAWRDALSSYAAAIAALPSERLAAHDLWYRHELPALVTSRAPMHVTHDEMVRITEWKMARGVWRAPNLVLVKNNAPGVVEDATMRAAGLLQQPGKALSAVTSLGGVGPATASAVLALMDPQAFPFFDELVARQVEGLGPVAWTAGYYRKYAEALSARAEQLRAVLGDTWTATQVERACWAAAIHAGQRA